MIKALLRRNLKAHYRLVLGFTLVLLMYFMVILNMYDPVNPGIMGELAAFKLPPSLLAAFGFDLEATELAGFLGGYFYGMLMIAFPMVLYIMLANKLVAHLVERGTMAAVLAAPVTRAQAALTQAAFLLACVFLQVAAITLAGLAASQWLFPGLMDIPAFLRLNLGALALHLLMSGISFFFSCLFSDTGRSLALGAGLPVFFLLTQMLSKTGARADVLKYLTPYTLFDPMALVKGADALLPALGLLLPGLALYALGILVFNRKDLPL